MSEIYSPAADRHDVLPVRQCGQSGMYLPAIALGFWHNFGDDVAFQTQRDIARYAFDHGVYHFDLANNYGPPPGSAEENFGRIMAKDFRPFRHEMIISTKAGWDMWPGPHGNGGSRKYLLNSLDESLDRMGLDYVDIFYHHRPVDNAPLEESMLALHHAVTSGKALYAGISSYSASATAEAVSIMNELGTPLVIHQPSYSLLNRWVEEGSPSLLEATAAAGMGTIAFSPLAQGWLTDKYLNGIPQGSRVDRGKLSVGSAPDEILDHIRSLNDIAQGRGQSLAQMAIAWILRDQGEKTVTTALVGASSVDQLADSLGATDNLEFSDDELDRIETHAVEAGINVWWNATKTRD